MGLFVTKILYSKKINKRRLNFVNQWQKGKFLFSFIYLFLAKIRLQQAEEANNVNALGYVRVYIRMQMCVCVECFLSMQRATTNMECFPLCGGVEKKGGMEDFLKERENSSVMNSRRDCLFHLPPFFFFLLCIFLFFFLIVYGVFLLLLLSGDSLWCYSNL